MTDASPDAEDTYAFTNYTLLDEVGDRLVFVLNVYYTPLLIACGTIGNLLIVYVFYTSKLRHQSTSQYLSALAVSDTVFLLQLLPPWLNTLQASSLFFRQGFCQVFVYLSYVTSSLSAWLVVAFTAERFVAVLYPLRRNAVCSVRRARYMIAAITAASTLLNTPVLRFVRSIPTSRDCNIDLDYLAAAARFNLMDTVVTFTIPLGVVVIMNVMITAGVCRVDRERQQLMRATHATHAGHAHVRRARPRARSQTRVTRMLLVVSTVFVLFNVPAYSMRVLTYTRDLNLSANTGRWHAVQFIAVTFFNTNFGINFLLYCLTGQNFRRALRECTPCLDPRTRTRNALRRADTFTPARATSVSNSFVSFTDTAVSPRSHRRALPVATQAGTSTCSFITRWKFDNSRQTRPNQRQLQPASGEHVPMRVFISQRTA